MSLDNKSEKEEKTDASDKTDMPKGNNSKTDNSCLFVPSLHCNLAVDVASDTTEGSKHDKGKDKDEPTTEKGDLVPAEVRVGDKIFLRINNIANDSGKLSNKLGVGISVDSPLVLQSRAETNFYKSKALHDQIRKERRKQDELIWVVVIRMDPLQAKICVSTTPSHKMKSAPNMTSPHKWISLANLWGAWCFRDNSSSTTGGVLWRLPAGDMYWGLANLKRILEEKENVTQEGEDETKFFRKQAETTGSRSKVANMVLSPALKMALVPTQTDDTQTLTVAWAPSGHKVKLEIANNVMSATPSWKECFNGSSNGCVIKNLSPGTPYKVKLSCNHRRPNFATFSTLPAKPKKMILCEWIGNLASNSRSVKINLSGTISSSATSSMINVTSNNSKKNHRSQKAFRVQSSDGNENWVDHGDFLDEIVIIGKFKVGKSYTLRSAEVLSDGTVGVYQMIEVGIVPKRTGLIAFDDDGLELVKIRKEGDGGGDDVIDVDASEEKVVLSTESTRRSHPVLDFSYFLREMNDIAGVSVGRKVEEEEEEEEEEGEESPWRTYYDENQQRTYYHNVQSGLTTWILPNSKKATAKIA